MEVTFIFSPAFFEAERNAIELTGLISATWIFVRIMSNLVNYFYYHQHNGGAGGFRHSHGLQLGIH
jgi:hypothetical protein